jgi:ATP-binding cassette, subfamily B, bacterial
MSETIVAPASSRRRFGLMWWAVRQADRKLATLILVTLVLSALAGAMQSVALKWIVDAAVDQRWLPAVLAAVIGGIGAGLLGSAGRAMSDTEMVVTNQVGLLIDHNSLELAASMPGIEHLERPAYLDQLALVRSGGPSLMRAVFTLTRTASLGISLVSSLWLLGAVHPLLLLTPLCAIPTAVLVPRSERYVDRAKGVAAERQRAATQLHQLFLTPTSAMELRVFGAADRIDRRSDQLWREVSDVQLRGAVRSALLASVGWLALTAGYVAALLFTANLAIEGRATVGDIVLVSQLALLIRGNVAQTADAARQASAALRTADRFLWLEDLHAAQLADYSGDIEAPARLTGGLTLRQVSFTYPGTDAPVLRDLDLHIEAGRTVAIVGDNGAGKTTLVKLLTGMYRPTTGAVLVDGVDLADLDIDSWRRRLSGAFQDFLRLESTARTIVGIGDPPALEDTVRIERAIALGGASSIVERLPHGLDTHVGKTYADGAELSGGQWQRVAISRSMMPEAPLCLILDEPTAALDPEAEQLIFDSYRRTAREIGERGAVTILISHRFSSVRMADVIVVLEGGAIVEHGTHDELMAADDHYARMYRQQADAYA